MDRWKEALFIAAVVGVVWRFNGVAADAEEAKTIMQQQVDINSKLAALIEDASDKTDEVNTKLKVYLELYGFDDSTAANWATMPRQAPHDTLGNGIPWTPWIETDSALAVGVKCMFNDSGRVLVDTLWSFRKAKK
jgi:hypothetical protein